MLLLPLHSRQIEKRLQHGQDPEVKKKALGKCDDDGYFNMLRMLRSELASYIHSTAEEDRKLSVDYTNLDVAMWEADGMLES
jgi:hypothetical protein